jgi:hypothetical protein
MSFHKSMLEFPLQHFFDMLEETKKRLCCLFLMETLIVAVLEYTEAEEQQI